MVLLGRQIGEIPLYIRRFSTCGPQRRPGGGPGEPVRSPVYLFWLQKSLRDQLFELFLFSRAKFENQLGKKGVVR